MCSSPEFNRSILKCKPFSFAFKGCLSLKFNRSILKCKLVPICECCRALSEFNRSILKCKQGRIDAAIEAAKNLIEAY